MSTDVKFKHPHSTVNKLLNIDIISKSLPTKTKLSFTLGLAAIDEETLRQCMLDVLKLLVNDYKK